MAYNKVREEIVQVAKLYAELLKKEMQIDSVYLYGSYVTGTFTEDSDIDIAVFAEEFTGDRIEDTMKLMKFRRKIDYRIEPHPFKISDYIQDNPYIQDILNNGLRI